MGIGESFTDAQEAKLEGIGGWLILPMIGLIATPIAILFTLVTAHLPVFTKGYWPALTTPGTESYHALWAPLIIMEISGNLSFFVISLAILVFFFQKSRWTPKLMVGYLAASLLFVVGDHVFSQLIPAVAAQPDSGSTREITRAIAAAVIWIPYFLVSKRVKQTFVR